MFRCRFFTARYTQARFFNGDTAAAVGATDQNFRRLGLGMMSR